MIKLIIATTLILPLSILSGCDNMEHQRYFRPFEQAQFIENDRAARMPPEGTIPQSHQTFELNEKGFPKGFKITRQKLQAGMKLFMIHCSACHGWNGEGRGIADVKGLNDPPSFVKPEVLNFSPSYIYNTITNGREKMPSYSSRLFPMQRWLVVAYVQALQLSRKFPFEKLDPEDKRRFK